MTISDGNFSIPYCYEGVEGQSVTIDGGTLDIVSYDDGINAAGGADGSGFGGRQDQVAADENCFIIVNGGTLDLTCSGNGNNAIDTNGSYANNGGTVTTNDGSESGTGSMGGRPSGGERPNRDGMGGKAPGSRPGSEAAEQSSGTGGV